MGQVAGDVGQVAAAHEGDELDLLALQQRAALRGVEGGPDVGAGDGGEAAVQLVELLQVATGGGDEEGGQGRQYWSTSSRVARMLRELEAPKTIACRFGRPQTHSIASAGGIAPEA